MQINSLKPGWKPKNFLVDFSMSEIIEKNVPSKFILISYLFCFRTLPKLENVTKISAQICAHSTNQVIVTYVYMVSKALNEELVYLAIIQGHFINTFDAKQID